MPSTSKTGGKTTGKRRTETTATTKYKIPPVIVRDAGSWTKMSHKMTTLGINFTTGRLTKDGIAVTPSTPDDHRRLTKALTEEKKEYHTYSLTEEKTARVVIRGLPDGITNDEIKEDLTNEGHGPISVSRMTSYKTRQVLPMVLVRLPLDKEDGLLKLQTCCRLVVRAEKQRPRSAPGQCHRCQRFGHAQSKCTATAKCVKCGQDHHSAECEKSRDEPATCANCGGPHPASYRGCAKAPATRRDYTKTAKQTTGRDTATAAPGRSYADAAKTRTTTTAENCLQEQMDAMMAQMIKIFTQRMQDLLRK